MSSASKRAVMSFYLGVLGLVCAIAVAWISGQAAKGLPWAQTTEVQAEFENVGTLKPGDAVRENSVRVGKVADVEYVDGRALVTFKLDGDVPVYSDARAAIWDESSLAKRFVEFHRGTESAGERGDDPIEETSTVRASDLDDVLDVFDARTRDKLQGLATGLGGGAAGHSRDLHGLLEVAPALLKDVETVTTSLSGADANLDTLITEVDSFARSFEGHEDQLAGMVDHLDRTLDAVSVDGGSPLEQTLTELPGTLKQADSSLKAVNPALADTRGAMTKLRPGARALGDATPDLRGVLREGVSPLDKVPGVSEDAEPALHDLEAAVEDARPLAPRLSEGLADLAPPLQALAPYSMDIVEFFGNAESMVSTQTGPGRHVARLGLSVPGLRIAGGGLFVDPMTYRAPYPDPGTAGQMRAPALLGGLTEVDR